MFTKIIDFINEFYFILDNYFLFEQPIFSFLYIFAY